MLLYQLEDNSTVGISHPSPFRLVSWCTGSIRSERSARRTEGLAQARVSDESVGFQSTEEHPSRTSSIGTVTGWRLQVWDRLYSQVPTFPSDPRYMFQPAVANLFLFSSPTIRLTTWASIPQDGGAVADIALGCLGTQTSRRTWLPAMPEARLFPSLWPVHESLRTCRDAKGGEVLKTFWNNTLPLRQVTKLTSPAPDIRPPQPRMSLGEQQRYFRCNGRHLSSLDPSPLKFTVLHATEN
jgi:hypothetical protein